MEDRAKVEIEVTAVVPDAAPRLAGSALHGQIAWRQWPRRSARLAELMTAEDRKRSDLVQILAQDAVDTRRAMNRSCRSNGEDLASFLTQSLKQSARLPFRCLRSALQGDALKRRYANTTSIPRPRN